MNNEHNFLITYGLHNFVTHALSNGRHTFTIRGLDNQKMIRHAKSLIAGSYGTVATVQVA